MVEISSTLPHNFLLGDRYKIIRQIGQGGFGRTYLAKDTHRYDEKCVLKEFAPLVENERDLQKAEKLFEREAGILYQLEHDCIPRFKALLRTEIDRKKALFLVQEYIAGKTYDELLRERGKFTESEVIDSIVELLPIIEYIHSQNLIHRDISPDNLIYRREDKKPVLIDFGCVKLAANAVSRSQGYLVTLIGKKGYAPEEQMRNGSAFPSSDLYALAATAIVLLTGKSPDRLYDAHQGKWQWEREIKVSSHFAKVLNKMLAYKPSDRYQSAAEVARVLNSKQNSFVNAYLSRLKTLIVAPKNHILEENQSRDEPQLSSQFTRQFTNQITSKIQSNISHIRTKAITVSRTVSNSVSSQVNKIPYVRHIRPWQWGVILLATATIPGLLTFFTTQKVLFPTVESSTPSLTKQEQNRQQKINQKIQALNVNAGVFFQAVDREFYARYPNVKNVTLTYIVENRQYRQIWYQIAEDRLEKIDQNR